MKVEVYKPKKALAKKESVRIIVKEGYNIDDLPDELKQKAGGFDLEKKKEIKAGEQRIALDSDEAIKNIEENGYHIQSYKVEATIKEGGTSNN